MNPHFSESMAAHVLTYDESPSRFEDFCVELFRDVDQVEYVRTSRSWDHGRDGRDASAQTGVAVSFICCSLRDDVLVKAVQDVKRLLEDAKPTVLLICSAMPVSEHLIIEVESEARSLCPTLETVRVNGQAQLSQLAVRHPRAMDAQYSGELADLRGIYNGSGPPDERQLTGLRIALTTQLHDDAQARRKDLVRVLVLAALEKKSDLTDQAMAAVVSQSLHLPRVISVAFLDAELSSMVNDGLIALGDKGYALAAPGGDELARRNADADKNLSAGQTDIRALIEGLTGLPLTNAEWKPVWNILTDGLSQMFLAQGAAVVQEIAALQSSGANVLPPVDLRAHIDGIAGRIRGIQGGGGRLEDVAQAVTDMFQERSSKAFEWLASLCVVYVDMCCLGFEPSAQSQIMAEIAHFDLLLDTDVVLSLLSDAEENHGSTIRLVEGWQSIGGSVFVAVPVLEEAAHHAWISQVDYDKVWRQLPTMSDDDAHHVVENVFVRAFRKAAGGRYGQNRWNSFISAFRGYNDLEYDKILGLLADLGIRLLPGAVQDDALAAKVDTELFQLRKGGVGNDVRSIRALQEKCNRDGRLSALLVGQRLRLSAQGRTLVVVSTSRAIRQAVSLCRDQVSGGEPVMYIGAIGWLLSLVPGVNLNMSVLRGIMFDIGHRKHMSNFELTVMRAVQASKEYDMHWSRRATLQRAVRGQLDRIAANRGQAPAAVREEVLSNSEDGRTTLAEALATAMDETARSLSERKVGDLQNRVAELEKELAAVRARKK